MTLADDRKFEIWKAVIDMQQSEANLHWQRNSYFAVVASILILAVSQFANSSFQVIVAILGLALSGIWLLIQHRSSQYIDHWKKESRKFESELGISIFPEKLLSKVPLPSIQMRYLAYFLPLAFLIIWIAIIVNSARTP
ncbi:MAG: Ca2+/Na+ antiporter [Candidatus Nitrosomirales archaeon]|jgi:Ca2+/Na+ antiporter